MTPEELKARTKKFADDIVELCAALPGTSRAQQIAEQLQDAGTSVGANYHAACQARSRREFISKISTCLEEADESRYWLQVIETARLLPASRLAGLIGESAELSKIFAASGQTASLNEAQASRSRSHRLQGSTRQMTIPPNDQPAE